MHQHPPSIIREYSTLSVSDVDIFPEESCLLVGDYTGCLSLMKYEMPSDNGSKKGSINRIGVINLDEGIITKIQPISNQSVWNPIIGKNSSDVVRMSAYVGTSDGGIYGFGFIEDRRHIEILSALQNNLMCCNPIGPSFSPWHHNYYNMKRRTQYGEDGHIQLFDGFLDGELIQSFLYMDIDKQLAILQGKHPRGIFVPSHWYEVVYLLEKIQCIG